MYAALLRLSPGRANSVGERVGETQGVGQIQQRHHVPRAGTQALLPPPPHGVGAGPKTARHLRPRQLRLLLVPIQTLREVVWKGVGYSAVVGSPSRHRAGSSRGPRNLSAAAGSRPHRAPGVGLMTRGGRTSPTGAGEALFPPQRTRLLFSDLCAGPFPLSGSPPRTGRGRLRNTAADRSSPPSGATAPRTAGLPRPLCPRRQAGHRSRKNT